MYFLEDSALILTRRPLNEYFPWFGFKLHMQVQWNLDLRKPDLRKNLDLRKIVATTNFFLMPNIPFKKDEVIWPKKNSNSMHRSKSAILAIF